MLHCAFERAGKERLISRTPPDDCIAPKVQKFERKTLHPEDMKAYLDTANTRGLLPMFYLALVSGLRTGEMYHPDSVAKLHEKILKDANLEHIPLHSLRHTCAIIFTQD